MTIEADQFDAERPRLTAIATRILGSGADADDVLQEAWLRTARAGEVDDVPAWLTTVVTRLCLDQLRRRGTRTDMETEAGTRPAPPVADPEADALLAERAGDAMQVVLDTLAPAERAAFVLHDVFGYPFEEISEVMGRSGTAVRQLASRARRKVQGQPEPSASGRTASRDVVDAFLAAARGGDMGTLLGLLAPDAVMRADRVGQGMGTPPAFEGAEAVAGRFNGSRGALPTMIDGELGAAWIQAGETRVAFVFHVEDDLIREVELIADPEVLATMDIVRVRGSRES